MNPNKIKAIRMCAFSSEQVKQVHGKNKKPTLKTKNPGE